MSEIDNTGEENAIDCVFKWSGSDNICTPIRTYKGVLEMKNFLPAWHDDVEGLSHLSDICYPGNTVECIDLAKQRREKTNVPKTLICHDLKGGYLEDRFVHGSSKHDEYRFFHWAGIDIFIYFSHQLLSIPPPMWINAAHRHGTKVLGTVITEWTDGEKVWNQILESDSTVEEFVDCLVSICINFSFDGYLLNIENIIKDYDGNQISRLILFVTQLHKKLHAEIPHAELIWYDSVTMDGGLRWQNELNDFNRNFFEVCDGIFLNYSWNEMNLMKSEENAGERNLDVYVGIDVFGRNFYEGGGYNCNKAVELARKYNLSIAIFAPGWVYEYLGGPHFVHLEYAFWQKLWKYLYIHGPQNLPFETSFCQGYGEKLYSNGKIVSNDPWYNLSKQQYQPTVSCYQNDQFVEVLLEAKKKGDITDEVNNEANKLLRKRCVQHYSNDAFNGGGCLQISQLSSNVYSHRLFVCNFECSGEILVSIATKPTSEDNEDLNILLYTENEASDIRIWILKTGVRHTSDEQVILPLKQNEIEELNLKIDDSSGETLFPLADSGWKLRHHLLELNERIVEVRMELNKKESSALFGFFRIINL